MVKSYYEAAGDWTPGREGREFDIALSYSKVCLFYNLFNPEEW
jgi:hypothetical protein